MDIPNLIIVTGEDCGFDSHPVGNFWGSIKSNFSFKSSTQLDGGISDAMFLTMSALSQQGCVMEPRLNSGEQSILPVGIVLVNTIRIQIMNPTTPYLVLTARRDKGAKILTFAFELFESK